MARRLAWVGLVLGAVWLVLLGGGWLGIYVSAARLATMAIAAAMLASWAVVAWRNPAWRPRSALLPALLLCLLSLGVSTVFSRSPRVSLEYLGYAIVLVLLYLLLVRLMADPFLGHRLLVLGALLFVSLVLVYVGAVLVEWVRWWGLLGRVSVPPLRPWFISLTYGNPSAVLTMVALLAVPAALVVPRRHRALGVGLVLAGVAVVALLSGSRAGWLALAVAALTGIAVGAVTDDGRSLVRRWAGGGLPLVRSGPGRVALVIGAVAVIAAAVVLGPAILGRVGAGGEDLRTTYAVVATRLFAASPIVGTGPGTWVIQRIAETQAGEPDYYIPHAHDVPLQTLAELGVVGALAGLVLIAVVLRLLVAALRSSSSERRWVGWLTTVALAYLTIHDLLDFYPNMPAVLFAAALPLAYLEARDQEAPTQHRRSTVVMPRAQLAGALAGVLAVAGLLWQEAPAGLGEQAVDAANQGSWATAAADARAAAGQDPAIHTYAMTAGIAEANLGDLTDAAAQFAVVADGNDLPEAWADLAAVRLELGQADVAASAAMSALRLGIQRAPIAMAAGDLLLRAGRQAEAIDAFAAAIDLRPSLAGDPWWTASPDRTALWPTILSRATQRAAPGVRWELVLMSGDITGAVTAASEDGAGPWATDFIAAWSGDRTTADRMSEACRRDPLDVGQLISCARVASHLGDPEAANAFRDIADGVTPGSPELAYEVRVAPSPNTYAATSETALFWGIYTYRRPTPTDLLVPGLIHLVLE